MLQMMIIIFSVAFWVWMLTAKRGKELLFTASFFIGMAVFIAGFISGLVYLVTYLSAYGV